MQLESYELRYGKSNCSWASCREGCTAEIFKCHQVRVTYTPEREYLEELEIETIPPNEWAYLTRTEKQVGTLRQLGFILLIWSVLSNLCNCVTAIVV